MPFSTSQRANLATRSTLSATVPSFSWKTMRLSFLACSSSFVFLSCSQKKRASDKRAARRSEEHTSELQSLMRISYAVFCLKKKNKRTTKKKYRRQDIINTCNKRSRSQQRNNPTHDGTK